VDALTWTSHSLRANRPYLLELEICDLDAQLSHVQRIAFIQPLPIGKRQKIGILSSANLEKFF